MAQLRNLCVEKAQNVLRKEVVAEFVERKINKICVYVGIGSVVADGSEAGGIDFSGGIFMVIKENVILINYMMVLIVVHNTFNKLRKNF